MLPVNGKKIRYVLVETRVLDQIITMKRLQNKMMNTSLAKSGSFGRHVFHSFWFPDFLELAGLRQKSEIY